MSLALEVLQHLASLSSQDFLLWMHSLSALSLLFLWTFFLLWCLFFHHTTAYLGTRHEMTECCVDVHMYVFNRVWLTVYSSADCSSFMSFALCNILFSVSMFSMVWAWHQSKLLHAHPVCVCQAAYSLSLSLPRYLKKIGTCQPTSC